MAPKVEKTSILSYFFNIACMHMTAISDTHLRFIPSNSSVIGFHWHKYALRNMEWNQHAQHEPPWWIPRSPLRRLAARKMHKLPRVWQLLALTANNLWHR